MLKLHPSNTIPATTSRVALRSWDERLFSWPWDPMQPYRVIRDPFAIKIGDNIYIHPETLPILTIYLERHGMSYEYGEKTFNPPKTQAVAWKI
jgi:hypothetical protein